MALDFPNSPNEGDTHTENGQTWTFTNGAWVVTDTEAPPTPPTDDPFAGYEWVDELANRSVNTDYVNTTGYTLFFAATRQSATSGTLKQSNITAYVDGIAVAMNTYIDRQSATGQAGIGAIPVPPGSTYRMSSNLGFSLIHWAEFKKKVTP